jgi:hypothetical protein
MQRMRNFLVFLILVMLTVGSCKRFSKKDYSLTVQEYMAKGMPDPETSWSVNNYFKAHITLGTLKIYNPKSLPRKQSRKSGAVFSRIVNKEILKFFDDPGLPLASRAMEIMQFARLQNDLIGMYSYLSDSVKYYTEELPDIYIFALGVQDKKLEIAGKIMNSSEQRDIEFQSGLPTVVYNYLNIIKVILGEQVKSKLYHLEDLERLSLEVSRSLDQNHKFILPADREALTTQIKNTIEESPSIPIKENYIRTLRVLNEGIN